MIFLEILFFFARYFDAEDKLKPALISSYNSSLKIALLISFLESLFIPFKTIVNSPKISSFSKNLINSKELGDFEHTGSVLEQLSSDVQVRLNAKYGVKNYQLNIFDNTKAEVVSKNYRQLENEVVSTNFGDIETIVVVAESEDVGPIKYYIAPSLDYMIIKSTATLKNDEERVLIISEEPKFSGE